MLSITEKELYWQEKAAEFSRTTDGLGMPIDEGILKVVIALNVLGITTRQSCEGHLERARAYPWVTFTTVEANPFMKQSASTFTQASRRKEQEDCTADELQLLYDQANQLRAQAEKLHAIDQQKVLEYLTAFYQDRYVPHDRQLIMYTNIPIISCLESQGAPVVANLSEKIQAQKLKEYQEEMQAFAIFLQQYFFLDL